MKSMVIKPNEFNNDALSSLNPSCPIFFRIFVIVLLVEWEKKLATEFDRALLLNSYPFRIKSNSYYKS